jgi:hypothetical protein
MAQKLPHIYAVVERQLHPTGAVWNELRYGKRYDPNYNEDAAILELPAMLPNKSKKIDNRNN